jgi:integrase
MVNLVFKYAIVEGHITNNPAADLHVALKAVPKGKHRSALAESDLPDFFRRLASYDGDRQTVVALKVVAHTFVRTDEIRFAKWDEFEGDIWRIPAERMKMGREHLVPLSRQSLALFDELRELSKGNEWVLPGQWPHKPISENTLLYAIYRLGLHSRATVHGFRATASTILNESELWDRDAIEIQLAHAPDDAIRAAYNRGDRWKSRVKMVQWYSDLLDKHEKAGLAQTDLSELLA